MPTINPTALKNDIDTKITVKTAPYSISNVDVGILLKKIVDYVDQENVYKTQIETFITTTNPHVYTIKENYILEMIVIVPVSDCNPYLQTQGTSTPGDIVPLDSMNAVPAITGTVWTLDKLALSGDINIEAVDVPIGSKLIFLTRKFI